MFEGNKKGEWPDSNKKGMHRLEGGDTKQGYIRNSGQGKSTPSCLGKTDPGAVTYFDTQIPMVQYVQWVQCDTLQMCLFVNIDHNL
jgi:hypothetical protein